MRVRQLHPWDVPPAEARRLQTAFAGRVSLTDAVALADLRHVAGVDNAYLKVGDATVAHAAVVVLTYPELEVVETALAEHPVAFPYVPGLLSFREAPAVLAAFARVMVEPDAVLDAKAPPRIPEAPHDGMRPRAANVGPDGDRVRRDLHRRLSRG
jgi:deoxyribonuclease V